MSRLGNILKNQNIFEKNAKKVYFFAYFFKTMIYNNIMEKQKDRQ